MRGLRPDTRYAWTASVDGTAHASGSFTTPPRTLDRTVRFAVLADYGSGNDNEWAVGRVLAAQRPEFAVTAGDNSYLVAAEPLLDRNIFRPLGDLIGSTPLYVCLGDHDNFWPGPGAISSAFDIPKGGRYVAHYGPIQVVVLGDQPNEPAAVDFARAALREPGPAVRFVACHRRCTPAMLCWPSREEGGAAAIFCGHLHRYERRIVDGVHAFTVGTGGQGPGCYRHRPPQLPHRRAHGPRARTPRGRPAQPARPSARRLDASRCGCRRRPLDLMRSHVSGAKRSHGRRALDAADSI